MALVKCPRCEINYMRDTDQYCAVCRKEMKMKVSDDPQTELCVECGENPALPGKDVCLACYQEGLHAVEEEEPPENWAADEDDDMEDGNDVLDEEAELNIVEDVNDLNSLQDIELEEDEDIPSDDLLEIQNDLGIGQEGREE